MSGLQKRGAITQGQFVQREVEMDAGAMPVIRIDR